MAPQGNFLKTLSMVAMAKLSLFVVGGGGIYEICW